MRFLPNKVNDAKIVIITNANPIIIAEINIPPKLLTFASDSPRLTGSL